LIPPEEPVWQLVADLGVGLLARTKNLRVILIVATALLETEGLPGLRDGVQLLRGVIENQWETFFPRLDPDDNNDPLERMNIIASLAAPMGAFGDPFRFIERVQRAPLASSRQLGRFSLRDMLVAKGDIPASPDTKPPEISIIEAAFADSLPADLQALVEAVRQAAEHTERIDAILDERVGVGRAPDLKPFLGVLRDVVRALESVTGRSSGGSSVAVDTTAGVGEEGSAGGRSGTASANGDITSARDVILALDRICRYYERNEVSSPIPFILKAARRMVSKNFVDIARIMTPEAIRTVEEMGKEDGSDG
jgi:type VI secretion system protein ImpA